MEISISENGTSSGRFLKIIDYLLGNWGKIKGNESFHGGKRKKWIKEQEKYFKNISKWSLFGWLRMWGCLEFINVLNTVLLSTYFVPGIILGYGVQQWMELTKPLLPSSWHSGSSRGMRTEMSSPNANHCLEALFLYFVRAPWDGIYLLTPYHHSWNMRCDINGLYR